MIATTSPLETLSSLAFMDEIVIVESVLASAVAYFFVKVNKRYQEKRGHTKSSYVKKDHHT